jgi:hypothetical protein
MTPRPGEFWLSAGGQVLYVERFDRYLRRLIVVDSHGNEFNTDENGQCELNSRTYNDLIRRLNYTSFPVTERQSK